MKTDKIYSRRRIYLPNLKYPFPNGKNKNNKNILNVLKIACVFGVAILTVNLIIQAITPILDKQCSNIAKSVATKISNEQASIVMSKYRYEDLCNVTKDNSRKYCNDKC